LVVGPKARPHSKPIGSRKAKVSGVEVAANHDAGSSESDEAEGTALPAEEEEEEEEAEVEAEAEDEEGAFMVAAVAPPAS
jgi:hypothetical protein